jgi:nitrite reductase (cytochrome c-552)
MALRVTRPGFMRGIQAFAESNAEAPALPSIAQWRAGPRKAPYDPNVDATRNELRSFVCGQCHVEYYCSSKMPLTFPWGKGFKAEEIEAYWDETKFPNGEPFVDYAHAETGAPVLKAQHPEFELWNQGIHARSGVSCADCHMPYMREGATKISDHWVRSPLLNINRACQTCHRVSEDEMKARVDTLQQRTFDLMERGGAALDGLLSAFVTAKAASVAAERLDAARRFQRKAQWRLDFVAAENSMGFHAPQETARLLAEAIDYARQGELALVGALPQPAAESSPAPLTSGAPSASAPRMPPPASSSGPPK